jgi:hypothetical protein
MEAVFTTTSKYKFIRREDLPVDIGIAAGTILGFVYAWIGLICYLNVEHWMAGVMGSIAGGLAGWVWYNIRHGEWNRT